MGNALAIYEKVSDPIAASTNGQLIKAASAYTGCSLDQAPAVIMTCMADGITLREYARTYHNMMGKSVMKSAAMLANFRTRYGGRHEVIERSANRAAIRLIDKDGNTHEEEFTSEDALASRWPWADWKKAHAFMAGNPGRPLHELAHLMKDNWATPTDWKTMLWWRCVKEAVAAFCPEVDSGAADMDEAIDAPVVATTIVTNKPSVQELAERAAERTEPVQHVQEVVQEEAAREIEAEFEDVVETATPTLEGPAESDEPLGEGYITRAQIDKLRQLYEECDVSWEKQQEALARRNVKAIHSLPEPEAKAMIDRLLAYKEQLVNP